MLRKPWLTARFLTLQEGEVLLWPGQKYVVTRAAYVEGGRTYIDMLEEKSEPLVF